MEISKPYKGKGKRKLKKMPFTVRGYIYYYLFFYTKVSPTPQAKQEYLLPFLTGLTPCPAKAG